MLRLYACASLLLLCAVCGAVSAGELNEKHSSLPMAATHHFTPSEEKTRSDVSVNDEHAIGGKLEESAANVNNTNITTGIRQNENVVVEHEPVSEAESESASQGEESPASTNKTTQASDADTISASKGNEGPPASEGELSASRNEENPTAQNEEGSDLPEEYENEEAGSEGAAGPGQPEDADTPGESRRFSLDEDERTGKILAYYTTKTKNLFATTTVSRLSTCFSATNTNQCQGRRKKRNLDRNIDASIFNLDSSEDLQGTAGELVEPNFGSAGPVKGDRDPKKFTVWSTLFSTFTLTSTYYYPGTTVTVSGVCVLPGLGSGCFG